MNELFSDSFDSGDISISYDREKNVKELLEERLKKAPLGGYTKPSVEQYAMEMTESMAQMRENFEKQIRTLSAECSKFTNECNVLRNQIQEAERENENAKQSLNAAILEKRTLEEQVQRLQGTASLADDYQSRIQELQREIQQRNAKIAEYEQQISQLQTKLQAALSRIEDMNAEISKIQEEAAQAAQATRDSAELDGVYEELETIKKTCTELRKQNYQLQQTASTNANLQTELEKYRNQLVEQQYANDVLRKKLSQQEETHTATMQQAESESSTMKENMAALEQKYGQLYDQYAASRGHIEQLQAEKNAVEQLLKKYQAREQEMAVLQEENTELKSAVAELQNVAENMMAEMERQFRAYQQMADLLAEKNTAINDLNTQKIELQMRNVHIMERMEALAKEQSHSTEKQVFPLNSMAEDLEKPMTAEAFSPFARKAPQVDVSRAMEILNRAKELSDSCTA